MLPYFSLLLQCLPELYAAEVIYGHVRDEVTEVFCITTLLIGNPHQRSEGAIAKERKGAKTKAPRNEGGRLVGLGGLFVKGLH